MGWTEGLVAYIDKFAQEWIFLLIVHYLDKQKFIVATMWLQLCAYNYVCSYCMDGLWSQLNTFTAWAPKCCKSYIKPYKNLMISVLNNYFDCCK